MAATNSSNADVAAFAAAVAAASAAGAGALAGGGGGQSVSSINASIKAANAAAAAAAAASAAAATGFGETPAQQLALVIAQMTQLLTGLNQGPIVALQALSVPDQQAYAQAIAAFSHWTATQGQACLADIMGPSTGGGGPDTSERGISVLHWDSQNNGPLPQAAIDAQNNKNAQAWCVANGWTATGGMSRTAFVSWIGSTGDWPRVANDYLWGNVLNTPGACALMDLDIYSQIFGDDSIFQYKKIIESYVALGPGAAYDTVWPNGYAEAWNTKFQSLHSQLHIFEQVAGPLAIVGGAALTAFGVSSAAGAALIGLGISDTVSSNQNPPEFTPGSTSSGPVQLAQITAAAVTANPPATPASGPLVIPPASQGQAQTSANAAPSALSTFPWLWAAVGVAAFGLLALIVVEA